MIKHPFDHEDDKSDHEVYLWEACEKFIRENNITCAETIFQTDRVIRNAYDFIQEICEIVGYEDGKPDTTNTVPDDGYDWHPDSHIKG